MGRRTGPEDRTPSAPAPWVNFSVYAQDDVVFHAKSKKVSSFRLCAVIASAVRRHGLDPRAFPGEFGRWRTIAAGLDVLYDVGPGDTVMVVQVSRAPIWLEETYASQDGDGGRLGVVQGTAHTPRP